MRLKVKNILLCVRIPKVLLFVITIAGLFILWELYFLNLNSIIRLNSIKTKGNGGTSLNARRCSQYNSDEDISSVLSQSSWFQDNLLKKVRRRDSELCKIWEFEEQNRDKTKKRLPKVIGIGVKKCGTDGVISFLAKHPLVKIPKKIYGEAFYFSRKNKLQNGIDQYRNMFPPLNDREITMEKTPIYFDHPPHDLPEQIKRDVPGVKLLLIVCDPTLRAFSDYVHERVGFKRFFDLMLVRYSTFSSYLNVYISKVRNILSNSEKASENILTVQRRLSELFETNPAATLLSSGLYFYHIQRWKRVFNDSSLMIIDGEKFKNNPGPIIEDIQDFIGIPKLVWKEDFVKHPETRFYCYRHLNEKVLNMSSTMSKEETIQSIECLGPNKGRTRNGAKVLEESDLNRLKEFYSSYNEAFFKEMNHRYEWN